MAIKITWYEYKQEYIWLFKNDLYKGEKTYSSKNDLWEILEEAFKNMSIDYLRNLYKLMERRMCDVLLNKDGLTIS